MQPEISNLVRLCCCRRCFRVYAENEGGLVNCQIPQLCTGTVKEHVQHLVIKWYIKLVTVS